MSDMFNGDEVQEQLDFLISSVLERTLDGYSLKNEPVDGSLEACLHAYTKVNLLKIAAENGIYGQQSWKKSKLVAALSVGIMDSLDERFLLLQERGLTLLQYMAEGKLVSDEYSYENVEFFLTVYQVAVRLGLIYTSEGHDEVVTIMPSVIKKHLDEALENFDELQVKYSSTLTQWDQMNEVLVAGLHLYGVMTLSHFYDLWEISHSNLSAGNMEEMNAFYAQAEKYLPLLIIDNNYFFVNKYIIGSSDFMDEEDVLDFYHHRLEKIGSIYYTPSKQEIEYYAKHSFDQESLIYKRLKQEVSKRTVETEMFMSLVEKNILTGEDISEFILESVEVGLIDFESEEEFTHFMDLYTNLANTSRLWENGGFTPSEMVEQVTGKYNFPNDFAWFDMEDEDLYSDNIISLDAFRRDNDED